MQKLIEHDPAVADFKTIAPRAMVVIGASTGGPNALSQILPKLPRKLEASIVIVQQMRPGFTKLLARQLDGMSEIKIDEAERFQQIVGGTAIIAPGDYSITIDQMGSDHQHPPIVRIEDVSSSLDKMKSRIDDAMISAAEQFGARTIGVLLTGIGDDGRVGMKHIREAGGRTIAQDEASCVVYDMPRAAIDAGVVDDVVPLWNIADKIVEIVENI